MFKRLTVLVLMLFVTGSFAAADTWNFDKAHSSIGFSVRHMVISKVSGTFGDYDGSVTFDGKDLSTGSVEVTIQMASINTDNETRDKHLRSADFFAVDEFPTMTFKSKKIVAGKDNSFTMVGDLTIKGVTKEVTLTGQFNGVLDDPWGNTRAGFSAQTTINRQDFNVSWENKLKDGSLVVSDDVTINIETELTKAK